MKKFDKVIAAGVPGIMAILFGIFALKMPKYGVMYQAPGFFPLLISCLILLLSILKTIQELKVYKSEKIKSEKNAAELNEADDSAQIEIESGDKKALYRTIYIVFMMAIFAAMMWYRVPFMISSAIFLAGLLFVFARKSWVSNIIIIAVMSIGMYYLFSRVFYVPLPY